MLGNGIEQTTGTTGTGNLTLAAVAGCPTFANVFALNQEFVYALRNASGRFIEAGIGYLSDATTLVRARVCSIYSGGVYTKVGATPVDLTGTTTVICTPHAATLESVMPTVDAQTAGINRMVTTAHRTTAQTAQAMTTSRLSYVPFLLRVRAAVNALSINVNTAGAAGKVARLGIYSCNVSGYPGTLLTSTADFAIDSTGLKTNSVSPVSLPAGWYYAASISDGAPVILMHTAGNPAYGGSPLGYSGTSPIDFRYEILADTNMPATANTTTTGVAAGAQHLPMVFVGVE